MWPAISVSLISFFIATLVVGWLARAHVARLAIDEPNARSLHTVPVPRTGGIGMLPPRWDKYNRSQESVTTLPTGLSVLSQYLPSLLFSGRLDRFPRLKWICAETGMGWFPYVLDACDHEWERRRLWNEGLDRRPSEIFREQVYVSFWFEQSGVRLRDAIGVDRILWQSDFPHNTSTYPDSWKQVRRTMEGVSALEQKQMLYANALQLYGLTHE